MPKVDPYPEPVALATLDVARVQRLQTKKGRHARLQRLARHHRDMAWRLAEHQRLAVAKPSEKT